MDKSLEYSTVEKCIKPLELALPPSGEGFITQEVHDDVLNPRSMLTDRQKAGELVIGTRWN